MTTAITVAIIMCLVIAIVGVGLSPWPVVGMICDIRNARRHHDQGTDDTAVPMDAEQASGQSVTCP
jgi:hypothetical protein